MDLNKKMSSQIRFEKIEESRISILNNNNDESSSSNKTLNTISEVSEIDTNGSQDISGKGFGLQFNIIVEESNSCKNVEATTDIDAFSTQVELNKGNLTATQKKLNFTKSMSEE